MKNNEFNLEIGKRYYLDEAKDFTGVLDFFDIVGDPVFNETEGNADGYSFMRNKPGFIPFFNQAFELVNQ